MRKILIVGAGQAGLQLGLSLRAEGYDVTIASPRTAEEIRSGGITSTQVLFGPALATERAYGLDHWAESAPGIRGLRLSLAAPPGTLALALNGELDETASSVDQRIAFARWLTDAQDQGIEVIHQPVTPAELDTWTAEGRYDLVVVAAGKGDLTGLFTRDAARSPYAEPQRGLAVAYVHGLAPDPAFPETHVGFNAIPGLGELFVIPLLTLSGPAHALFWEAVPGGPLDRWASGPSATPAEHLAVTLELAREYLPWVHERTAGVELADARATLSGRYTPTVRHPVAHLPGGGFVLGLGDVLIANDPITGQGSNTAAKAAAHYLRAILDHGDRPFDAEWATATFETFWSAHGEIVTGWTNAMLQPLPPHIQQILGAAASLPPVARRFANGFADPNDFASWLLDPSSAEAYLTEVATAAA
ncbi:styrene monooxygenase/indole monooxygenase family protein [Actinoplanes sp. NPDC051851]|uniref:styrene monooxygenase/indole monooxygenase family protein n=1 Tax=Actinoplanes sp. NPDC051851 TaxID=3154753 RepID=UPI00343B9555